MQSRSDPVGHPRRRDSLVPIAALAFMIGTALRFGAGLDQPLRIDEAFTGAIAAQLTVGGFLHQIWADVNAPLYYVMMLAWAQVAGLSDVALHLPSALCAAGAVVLALRGGAGLDRRTCWIWGALLALWQPGIAMAADARCYALLLLLATAGSIAFARMLAAPTRGNAVLWATVSALAILTHYYALPVVGAQGLVFVAHHRGRAVRTWPALLAFLPAFGWIAYHAGRLAAFARPDIAWYAPLEIDALPEIVVRLFGVGGLGVLLVALVAHRRRRPATPQDASPAVAWAALIALAVILAAGLVRPSFNPRYCVPCMPGLLLGLAAFVGRGSAAPSRLPACAIVLFGLPTLVDPAPVRGYGIESASAAIGEAGARRLVFLWDHPSSPIQDPAQMRAVGGFFLARAGHPVTVEAIAKFWREDPNPRLLAAAGSDPHTAILWIYDKELPKTAALAHPPRIEASDPAWRCSDHAGNRFVVLACLRRDGNAPPERESRLTPAG